MAKCELIELQDLTPDDRIELAPPSGAHPATAPSLDRWSRERVVRMVGERVRLEDPDWLTCTPGRGHDFQPCSQTQLSWCDLCGEFIWGLYRQSLRCTHCNYTCHYRCQPFIQLDCSSNIDAISEQANFSEDTIETDTNVDEQEEVDWRKQDLSATEIQQKVKEYNAQVNSNLFMVLNRDGSYTGFIKVQFKLARPVSLPPPRGSSSSCSGQERTSFYLPRDTVKHLHISSSTRAREVIQALLNKFTVVDNPAKYSLYERSQRHNQVYLRKLADDEHPLFLRLCAGPNEKVLSLVLKENETGEVNPKAKKQEQNQLHVFHCCSQPFCLAKGYYFQWKRKLYQRDSSRPVPNRFVSLSGNKPLDSQNPGTILDVFFKLDCENTYIILPYKRLQ